MATATEPSCVFNDLSRPVPSALVVPVPRLVDELVPVLSKSAQNLLDVADPLQEGPTDWLCAFVTPKRNWDSRESLPKCHSTDHGWTTSASTQRLHVLDSSRVVGALLSSPVLQIRRFRQQKKKSFQPYPAAANRSPNKAMSFVSSKIGQGSFGSVYKTTFNGKPAAIKMIHDRWRGKCYARHAFNELNAHGLKHPNVVKLLAFLNTAESTAIVYEYVGKRNLQMLLLDPQEIITSRRRLSFCQQVAEAMRFCHAHHILHLDLKTTNILVTDTDDLCKLADFGCSQPFHDRLNGGDLKDADLTDSISLGTVIYKAPELLQGFSPTTKADVYSYSYVVWECLCRSVPFSGMDCHAVIFRVVAQLLRPPFPPKLPDTDQRLVELANQCWNPDPKQRPEFRDVCFTLSAL